MKDDGPRHFYKYRSLAGDAKEQTRQTIVNNAIWFAKPKEFNDPFDCAPDISLKAPVQAFEQYAKKMLRQTVPLMSRQQFRLHFYAALREEVLRWQNSSALLIKVQEQLWQNVNEAGILSLSTQPDHVLMWSHYTASHTGICLRFSCTSEDFPFHLARRVIYCAERPVVNPILDNADDIMSKFILSKSHVWSYEDEWRVLNNPSPQTRRGGGHGLVTYHPSSLNGIILGARISKTDEADVATWIQGRGHSVKLFRAVPNPNRFQLDIVSIPSAF